MRMFTIRPVRSGGTAAGSWRVPSVLCVGSTVDELGLVNRKVAEWPICEQLGFWPCSQEQQ